MFDVFLNIVATAIPIAVLQLCIYPLIATNVDDEIYGLFLTQISVLTIISGSLGNALNNIRLVKMNNMSRQDITVIFRYYCS